MREACPRCRESGKDTAGDNFIRYSDGHGHCFACGLHVFADTVKLLDNKVHGSDKPPHKNVSLPSDARNSIDFKALSWLASYDIEMPEVKKHKLMWSHNKQMLIFPIYSAVDGELLAWQGRSFASEGPKSHSEGPLKHILVPMKPLEKDDNSKVVLVEDFVSAMKVSRQYQTLCMFGSTATVEWIRRIKLITDTLYFWLDQDMGIQSMMMAKAATQQGFKVKVIITREDPKRYTNREIQEAVEG